MKKFLSALLSLAMIFTFSTSVLAADRTTGYNQIEAVPDTSYTANEAIYFDDNTIADGQLVTFDEVKIAVPSNTKKGTDIYLVRSGIKKSSNGNFTWFFNVDCPSSPLVKPNIKLTAQLKGSFTTLNGSYSNVGLPVYHNYTTNAEYGVDYTWTVPAKTGYYYLSYTILDYSNANSGGGNCNTALSNRSGHQWTYAFSDTGKSLPMPRADWTKGAIHNRPNGLNNTYYAEYEKQTGKVLDRSLYDVHHIQPLAYGGDNSYGNLIHLPKDLHKKVTGWFNGY